MKQIVQLESNDDLASIRSRLEVSDLSHLVLVVPRECPALENDRGVHLLRRAAEDLGIELALVARDGEIRERADLFGIPVYESVAQARRDAWKMKADEELARKPRLVPELETETARRNSRKKFSIHRKHLQLVIAAFAGAIILLLAAAILFVPAANVRIVPASTLMTLSTDIGVDPTVPQINSETRAIPARRVTREISGTAQLRTTATKSVADARSTGTVVFTNLRTEETAAPMGTIVKTSAGVPIRFSTTVTGTIPAGINNRTEVPVQAVEPGPSGNVRELAINAIEGSLNLEARVINLRPTAAGNVKSVKVVTADDKKKLQAQLLQQLKQQSADVLKKDLRDKEFIPPDSIVLDVNDETFDRSVDDPAEILNMRMTADIYALAVDPEDMQSLVRALLLKELKSGYQILPNSVQTEALPGGKYQYPAFRFLIRGSGYATPQLDGSKVARALEGKSAEEAAKYLTTQVGLAQSPTINVFPPGWNRMPWFSFRIAVFVEPQTVSRK